MLIRRVAPAPSRHGCFQVVFSLTLLSVACSSTSSDDDTSTLPARPDDRADAGSADGSARPSSDASAGTDAGPHAPLPIPKLVSSSEVCKVINREGIDDPTDNKTHFTANLRGTDLGIPVAHDGTLYVFFGDTIGFKGIWSFGDSQPDAVGYSAVSASAVAKNPALLCTNLRFVSLPAASSVGPKQDNRIEADFAGEYMRPPPGHTIGEYIRNPAGKGAFPNLPGDFEVPSGAFSYGGSIWLFFTTVDGPESVQMKGSYLAKWATPSTSGVPAYDIQYKVDQRFDANGPMRGDFINIAALVHGDYVYLYGTGDYRRSKVHLARKKLTALATENGFERYDAATSSWKAQGDVVTPIVDHSGNGEMSVRYYPEVGRFMMLNQEQTPTQNRILARFAEAPEGPWSDAVVVNDMADPAFRAKYCCGATTCTGEQLFHCDRAGFYGAYLLPEVQVKPDGTFVATYFMSTWDPYNVALMQATFE